MSAIELAPELAEDFGRILEHLVSTAADDVSSRIVDSVRAIDVLERNPLIGRPAGSDLLELVIGRGSRGYIALYRCVDEIDTVFVPALRSQREAGYAR
jgi:plasmid stabilization system protein ParE